MSVWATEEVMRRTLRFCSHRSNWIQRLVTPLGNTSTPQYSHIRDLKRSQTCLPLIPVRSVRFHSQGTINRDDVKPEKGTVSSPSSPPSPPPEEDSSLDNNNDQSAVVSTSVQWQNMSPFAVQLQSSASPSDVLDLTLQYSPTVREVGLCLTKMWSITKKLPSAQQRLELQLMSEHPAFKKLLQRAMEDAQHMNNESLAYCTLGLVNLGVSQNSRVVQTFLRTCQVKLNSFNEKELSILASCLPLLEGSHSVTELKQGLSLIIEARLPGIQNIFSLQKMMRILGKDTPRSLKEKLERKALSMTDQFSLPNAQHMISIMASMGFLSKPLMDICTEKILGEIYGIPFSRLLTLLHACRELRHRDKELFTGISDHLASTFDLWTNKQVLCLLSTFELMGFCPASLMKAFAERVIDSPDILTHQDLQCVLKVYASLNFDLQHHRQPFLDSLSRVLESYLSKMAAHMLLNAVFRLCQLGHFPPAPLEQLLQDSTLGSLSNTSETSFYKRTMMLQTVDLCLRLDRPPLPHPLSVPPSFLVHSAQLTPSVRIWPSQVLHGMLGSRTDVELQPAVMVEDCYFVDAVMTNSQTVQTSLTERSRGESPAEGSQKIAFICTRESHFCFGTTNPRADLAIKLRHLKLLGYSPVLVPEKELSLKERTKFLTRWNVPEHHRSDPQVE